ncbi:CUB domain protein [Ancylostoma caninum]|uniref:CUB domain protein n=1 Tax=Ancylostoma caninum TaxID=29170 RepID=A0A368GM27_ANCCA|nr:CUB domain protein [Ancylostoma caninum]
MLVLVYLLSLTVPAAPMQNASFSGAQGIIYSPGYPDNYQNQINQYYTISVDPGYYIHLTLYDFETEACCDKLYIWDGGDITQSTVANVSGDATGQTFSSSGPVMTLLFNTDITANTQYSEPSTCQSGLRVSGMGFVTSPDWPSPYPNDVTCNYLMTMPKGSRVMLTFVAFSTEACCDKVEIYDGPNSTFPKLAVLSGNTLVNSTYYSTQQSMFLTFYSDYTQNDKGFSAYYMQIT